MQLRWALASFVTATSLGLFATSTSGIPPAIEPTALWNELKSKASGWLVLDIRPAWQFAEFHIPGAKNLAPGDVATSIAAAGAGAKVVVVDRDGTAAWAVAGAALATAQAGTQDVRVLAGGTLRWWNEIELRSTPADTRPSSKAATASQPVKPRSSGC